MRADDAHTDARGRRRWQNFDAIRLSAATVVVLSHCYMLSATGYEAEPFVRLFGHQQETGLAAVGVFFVISGFLITPSFIHRASTLSYLVNRAMRIFPALIVCTVVTAFAIGPFFASNVVDYVTDGSVWEYIWRTSALQPAAGVNFPVRLYPGTFGLMMLGTTWSLPVEFQCYVLVVVLGTVGMLRLPAAIAVLAFGVWAHTQWSQPYLESASWALMFFAAGVVLHFVHERWRPPARALWVSAALLVVAAAAGYPFEGLALFGSVLVIQLATSERIVLPDLARYGDLSYGVYLYGWPIQQVIRVLWGPSIIWWQMFLLTMPIALGCAWLSWHLIEARALALAKRFQQQTRIQRQPQPAAAIGGASPDHQLR